MFPPYFLYHLISLSILYLGYGWANWLIGAVYIEDGFSCGDTLSACDPYVQIEINNINKFTSTKKQNIRGYHAYDEMYRTPPEEKLLIDDTTYTIHVKDDDYTPGLGFLNGLNSDDEILAKTWQMCSHMTDHPEKPNELKLFLAGYCTYELK